MNITIDPMRDEDWQAVQAIYREGIATGNATFETDVPDWETWDRNHLPQARLVAKDGERVAAWGALTPVSGRCVYGGVAEISLYVAAAERGRGIGKTLLSALIAASEEAGLWTLQVGIFPENAASLALSRSCGFRQVGRQERIGQMRGVWRDVILLERRSRIVGV